MEQIFNVLATFVRDHQAWGPPVVALLAFCESLAIISLFVPATSILIGIGVFAAASSLPVLPMIIAGAVGAALGDVVSYWFGKRYGADVKNFGPFKSRPEMLARGEVFFQKWGASGVFIGRFFGPLRAIVPLLAGISHMPNLPFQIANWSSALLWSALLVGGPSFGWKLAL